MTGSRLVAAVDIGSTKVVCFVACEDENGGQRILGVGQHASRGVLSGTVVNMEAAGHSVASAASLAEGMTGETLRRVWISVSGGQPVSNTVAVDVSIAGHEVGDADLRRVVHKTRQAVHHPARVLLHAIPVDYSINGNRGIRDPRGMVGERLGVRVHMVSTERGPIANLETCIARCHLDVAGRAAAPCASALACLVEDEMDMGVTVIDFGGGTTSLAMFVNGDCVHVDSVAIGGQHITSDIAEALSTPAETAERIKTLHGNALGFEGDRYETVEIPVIGEREGAIRTVSHAELAAIIRPRVRAGPGNPQGPPRRGGLRQPGQTPACADRRCLPAPWLERTGRTIPQSTGPYGPSDLAQGTGKEDRRTRLHGVCRAAEVRGKGRRDRSKRIQQLAHQARSVRPPRPVVAPGLVMRRTTARNVNATVRPCRRRRTGIFKDIRIRRR